MPLFVLWFMVVLSGLQIWDIIQWARGTDERLLIRDSVQVLYKVGRKQLNGITPLRSIRRRTPRLFGLLLSDFK